jgi:DNA helicase HerA-like ATPase
MTGQIGRVVGVASTKVRIQLDAAATGLSKVGADGIATVGAVNSYVVMPAGAHRVVAIVTAVRIFGESSSTAPVGTEAQYELDAVVTGRFEGENFKSGLAGYPALHAPVFCASSSETRRIFVPGGGPGLRIGSSAVAAEQEVLLDANLLLAHHTAIVGSTGSGKSCTVMAILDGLLEMDVPGAHIVIFDINGEYKDCFNSDSGREAHTFVAGPTPGPDDGLILPHWFMNNEEHLALLRASEGVQAPVLQRAIADARVADASHASHSLDLRVASETAGLIESIAPGPNPQTNLYNQLLSFSSFLDALSGVEGDLQEIWQSLHEQCLAVGRGLQLSKQDWTPLTPEQRKILGSFLQRVRAAVREGYNILGLGSTAAAADFDAPVYYDLDRLCDTYLPQRIALEQQSDSKIAAYVSTMQMRLSRLLADGRYDFMTRVRAHDQPLGTFLRAVLGADPLRGDKTSSDWPARDAYSAQVRGAGIKPSVTIFDLSLIATDVLENVTSLLGRLLFDFAVRSDPRASHPMLLVLEEAHRFVPRDQSGVGAKSAAVFERIAKEGRKFGVGLVLASQRPSELAETVVAQCGTVIAHRLTHEDDQSLLRHATPFVSHDLLSQLPGMAQQHALITGVATAVPVAVRIRDVPHRPRSNDPDFVARWRDRDSRAALGEFVDSIATRWEGTGSFLPPA